ncbi:MAG TPA: hypothetical protein VFP27_18280 [Mycobacterium sp.]|nr:hypothetical protein [Mycobacterium sp.]
MHRKLIALAAAVSMVLLVSAVAAAATVTTTFEPATFHPGSVDGQDGWHSAVPGDIPALPLGYDQAVVANIGAPPAFGSQSLRHSNAYNEPTGEYFYQTYSRSTVPGAGEELPDKEFTAQFSFISTTPAAQQPGLNMTMTPDNGVGARMSYVGLRDGPAGIRATVYDTPEPNGAFVAYDGGLLDRTVPHTIRFWIKLNPGPDNDLVRIYIDGQDLGKCFTTWENFYRSSNQGVQILNSIQFRSSGGEVPGIVGKGYLFDNVTTTSANGAGPPGCDVPIEKTADSPTVTAGGRAGYRITVRNRGRLAARNLRACDRIPRQMTFVSADRRLRRIGRQRCLAIPRLQPGQRVSFHLVLQVNPNAPQGRVTNTGEVTPPPVTPPGPGPGSPASPGLPASPGGPPAVIATPKPIAIAKAAVKIVKRAPAQRPAARPPFTG